MRIATGVKLFMGVKVDQKIREQLEQCSDIDKRYFAAGDPDYLTFAEEPDGARYLGRALGEEVTTDDLDDIRRNILSILKRVAPSVRPERALIMLPCTL
ncbi:MAG TPA: hypothetical protein VKN99_14460 [Polyangia bacterium]|nr:hypothetical protein [Polyangia bacterium]